MKQEDHELIVLQMMKEIKARGTIFSGTKREVQFLLQNKMILREGLREVGVSHSARIRYTITPVGEGLVRHLKAKHESKELQNAKQGTDAGEGSSESPGSDAGSSEGRTN